MDFGAFPQKFVDLLEICAKEETRDVPKYGFYLLNTAQETIDDNY